jgi:hypothetical protein
MRNINRDVPFRRVPNDTTVAYNNVE